MLIKIKCPCETYANACCACVSMHCDECHDHSKFQQGSYCSHCGRPLKAELQRNYVPRAEVERLRKILSEYEETSGLKQAKREVAREIFEEICEYAEQQIEALSIAEKVDTSGADFFGGGKQAFVLLLDRIAELKKKYTGEQI